MIVVDSNIIIYLNIQGERTSQALLALRKDPCWIAPPLWESEFRNVLAGYLRRRILDLGSAKLVMRSALQIMAGREILPPSDLVLDMVVASECSAYDCEYVALASHLKTNLITSDKKIVRSFPETAVDLDSYSVSA
jgi:predicted nucleic acid-binding protein